MARWRTSPLLRYSGPVFVVLLLVYLLSLSSGNISSSIGQFGSQRHGSSRLQDSKAYQDSLHGEQHHFDNANAETNLRDNHPITLLIENANNTFDDMLQTEAGSLAEASAAYRKRRGRHPPPNFDVWYRYAKEQNAIIVEEFWDQIYHDLNPFWVIPPSQLRREAREFEMTISIRSGWATTSSNWFWTQIWLKMIQKISHLLPDMDLALNAMDEPRVVVPWEKMDEYLRKSKKVARMPKPDYVVSGFERLKNPNHILEQNAMLADKKWETNGSYWDMARRGCPPKSAARRELTMTEFDHAPVFSPTHAEEHLYYGFVHNSTLSRDICHQPDLQGLEGIFINPLSISSTQTLFPIFGGSKLTVNNDILLPAPMYWNEEDRFSSGDDHGIPWSEKNEQAIWRGVATGGKNLESNWRGFQRHRFVAMNNGTKLFWAEAKIEEPVNFELPDPFYEIQAQKDGRLGTWVESWSNCSFINLMCSENGSNGTCPYTDAHFSLAEGMPLGKQFDSKYLPDIDGNSFSGRYLAFLRSTSLPIKSTIWREWHDSRLVAWKHFVPMDNRFLDWLGIMQYFLGYGKNMPSHDAAAERIAQDGKEWAEKVLRKEDMQIYVLRLLLEYARVSDEKRDMLGWVGDLTARGH